MLKKGFGRGHLDECKLYINFIKYIVVPSLRSVPISPKKHPKFKNVHNFFEFLSL